MYNSKFKINKNANKQQFNTLVSFYEIYLHIK